MRCCASEGGLDAYSARANVCTSPRERFRAWPIWELPHGLATFIVVLTAVYVAALGLAAGTAQCTRGTWSCSPRSCCASRPRSSSPSAPGENAGVIKDVYAVWELPIAILLPPVFVLVAPLIRIGLTQWRIRRIPGAPAGVRGGRRRACPTGSPRLAFHAIARLVTGPGVLVNPGRYSHAQVAGWLLAVAAAAVLQWAANLALVLPAIKASDPCLRMRDMIFDRERVQNDVAELSVAVLVTLGVAISLVTIVFALPFVTLLQRSMRHAQLLNASRIDSKTGLLNAGTWEREAASEVARAVRTRSPAGPRPDRCRSFQDGQ